MMGRTGLLESGFLTGENRPTCCTYGRDRVIGTRVGPVLSTGEGTGLIFGATLSRTSGVDIDHNSCFQLCSSRRPRIHAAWRWAEELEADISGGYQFAPFAVRNVVLNQANTHVFRVTLPCCGFGTPQ